MQTKIQLANAALAGAQPAEQGGIALAVVETVGGKAQTHRTRSCEKRRRPAQRMLCRSPV
jgi:hypothetical protein